MTERSPPLRDAGEFGIAIERLEELIELARKSQGSFQLCSTEEPPAQQWCPGSPEANLELVGVLTS